MLDTILERPAIDDAQMRRNAFNFGVPFVYYVLARVDISRFARGQ